MTEPNTEVKNLYNMEQAVSANSYFDTEIDGNTAHIQVTTRNGATTDRIVSVVSVHIEALQALAKKFPRAIPAPAEPTRVQIDDNGNDMPEIKVATAGRLSMDVKDNKPYYKVMDCTFKPGERGTKYGITIWPEALQAAGIDVSQPFPDIAGWRVDYVLNDKGYPQKVTRLLPPK